MKVNKIKQEKTTIQLYKTTRDVLKALGKKGESYDNIVKRLIEINKSYNNIIKRLDELEGNKK